MAEPGSGKTEITITRLFDASRKRLWRAWTDPEQVKRWWGPRAFTSPDCRIDLRVGGSYLFSMRSPDGKDFWSTGVYREIEPLQRIVATDSFADEHGNVVPATHYGLGEDFPNELLVTVSFEEEAGKTRLTLHHSGFVGSAEETEASWNESLDKLAESLR